MEFQELLPLLQGAGLQARPGGQGPSALALVRVLDGVTEALLEAVKQDVAAAAMVRCPEVLAISEWTAEGSRLRVVYPWLDGVPLAAALQRGRDLRDPPSITVVGRILLDACAGLAAMHRYVDPAGNVRPIPHGGFRPDSLWLGFDGQVRVADAGLASLRHRLERGTPPDLAADVLSAGMLMYWALTGQPPPQGATAALDARAVDGNLPAAVSNVIQRATNPNAAVRPSNAMVLVVSLENALKPLGGPAGHADVMAWLHRVIDANHPMVQRMKQVLAPYGAGTLLPGVAARPAPAPAPAAVAAAPAAVPAPAPAPAAVTAAVVSATTLASQAVTSTGYPTVLPPAAPAAPVFLAPPVAPAPAAPAPVAPVAPGPTAVSGRPVAPTRTLSATDLLTFGLPADARALSDVPMEQALAPPGLGAVIVPPEAPGLPAVSAGDLGTFGLPPEAPNLGAPSFPSPAPAAPSPAVVSSAPWAAPPSASSPPAWAAPPPVASAPVPEDEFMPTPLGGLGSLASLAGLDGPPPPTADPTARLPPLDELPPPAPLGAPPAPASLSAGPTVSSDLPITLGSGFPPLVAPAAPSPGAAGSGGVTGEPGSPLALTGALAPPLQAAPRGPQAGGAAAPQEENFFSAPPEERAREPAEPAPGFDDIPNTTAAIAHAGLQNRTPKLVGAGIGVVAVLGLAVVALWPGPAEPVTDAPVAQPAPTPDTPPTPLGASASAAAAPTPPAPAPTPAPTPAPAPDKPVPDPAPVEQPAPVETAAERRARVAAEKKAQLAEEKERKRQEAAEKRALLAEERERRKQEAAEKKSRQAADKPERKKQVPEEKVARAPDKASAKAAPGTLEVKVAPWADVWLDGKKLGTTPLPAQTVKAGKHTLRLANKELKVDRKEQFTVEPGEAKVLKFKLNQ